MRHWTSLLEFFLSLRKYFPRRCGTSGFSDSKGFSWMHCSSVKLFAFSDAISRSS